MGDIVRRFRDSLPADKKRLIVLGFITVAIPLTVILALTQQDFYKRAEGLPATPATPPTPTDPTPTPTEIPTPIPTETPIPTPTPTLSPSPTPSDTPVPTPTSQPSPSPTPAPIPGDFDGNGTADIIDFNIWRDEFLGRSIENKSDANKDGKLDLVDYIIWRNHY